MNQLWQFLVEFANSVFMRPAITEDPTTQPMNIDTLQPWTFPSNCRHNVRVLCDLAGLKLYDKNVITACVQQESQFSPTVIGKPNSNGTRDWGICQFNDGVNVHGQAYWIGKGAHFPSTQFVLDNPEACVQEMIRQYKAGNIHMWSSYSTNAYLKYMPK